MENFGSQASQDLFVLGILDHLTSGFYLEIGAGHPEILSNTWLLEKLGWKGVSVDNGDCAKEWQQKRKNHFFNDNACSFDYAKKFKELDFPTTIDYLTLDIDEATNLALKTIPFNEYNFKVITIEHDYYRLGDMLKSEQRAYLNKLGYVRLCSDISNDGLPYEDWYVSPEYASRDKLEGKDFSEVIKHYGFDRNRLDLIK